MTVVKISTLFFALFLFAAPVYGQRDLLIMKNGDRPPCKVSRPDSLDSVDGTTEVRCSEVTNSNPLVNSSLSEKSIRIRLEPHDRAHAAAVDPPPEVKPNPATSSDWEFYVTPYFFMPRLTGTVSALGQAVNVNAKFSDLFHNLDFALMGTFEARKGNWGVTTDAMYISLSGKRVTATILVSDINVNVKEFISTSEVGYRAFNTERGSIDLLAGARVWHVKSHVVFKPIIFPLVDVEEGKTWVDPVIGARGVAKVSSKVFVVGKFDAGGFGISSQFTGEVFGGVGYQLKPRVALIGGYRYLYVNYEDGGFVYRTALSGLAFGVKFKF